MNTSIQLAAQLLGSQTALAKAAGVTQPAVFKWLAGSSRPNFLSALAIERATNGAVTRHDLRPDIYPNPTDALPPEMTKEDAA